MKALTFIVLAFLLLACIVRHPATKQSTVKSGITGMVVLETGNQMPMKNTKAPEAPPFQTTVGIFPVTNTSQVKPSSHNSTLFTVEKIAPIATVFTNKDGHFSIDVKPGKYSVFVKKGSFWFCNLQDAVGNLQVVEVKANQVTPIRIVVNDEAVY